MTAFSNPFGDPNMQPAAVQINQPAPVNIATVGPKPQTIIVPEGSEVIIFNKQFAPALITERDTLTASLQAIGAIQSQDDVVKANNVLKSASRFEKKFDEQRKAMGEELTKYKDALLVEQRQYLSELSQLIVNKNAEIVNFQREEDRKAKEKQAEIQKQRDKEIAEANAEALRKNTILNLINTFEQNCLRAISESTVETIDTRLTNFDAYKLSEPSYQEYYEQALQMQRDMRVKFLARKEELRQLDELRKTNETAAAQLQADQKAQAERDEELRKQRIQDQQAEAAEQAQSDIANSQMQAEFKTGIMPKAANVMKRWKADFDTIDMSLLPVEYHTADMIKINAAIKAGCREIPGVKITEEISNVKR